MNGVVVKFDRTKGYGFIRSAHLEEDLFVHISEVKGRIPLEVGQALSFQIEEGPKGLRAVHVLPGKKRPSPYVRYGSMAFFLVLGGSTAIYYWISLQMGFSAKLLLSYLLAINGTTLLFYGYDKWMSSSSWLRIPEKLLQGLALLGGSPFALLGQRLFHHKSRKASFQKTYWAIVFFQVILLWYLYW